MRHVDFWVVKRGPSTTRFESYIAAYAYHMAVIGSMKPHPVYVEEGV